jgi:hypothetical protein
MIREHSIYRREWGRNPGHYFFKMPKVGDTIIPYFKMLVNNFKKRMKVGKGISKF